MTLAEAITVAENVLERPLLEDEILMLGQLVKNGVREEALIKALEDFDRPAEVPDDEINDWIFEPDPSGEARRIQ